MKTRLVSFWFWFSLWVFGSFADYWYTQKGIKEGIFREANPVINWIIQEFGLFGILGWKIFWGIVIALIAIWIYFKKPQRFPSIERIMIGAATGQCGIALLGWRMLNA